ncbi:MAG: hypothetical protein ACREQN_12195 [Candidatus Binataceae bacterium]
MAYDIRPLSFGEILDRGFRVCREHFPLLAGITFSLFIPYGVLLALGEIHKAFAVIGILLFVILVPVMIAALTLAVASVCLDQPMTVVDAYQATRPILPALIGTYVLFYALLILAGIALLIPAIYFGICWSLVVPVMIVERRFGMDALRRSRGLVRGSWWRTLGVFFVAALIVEVPVGVLQLFWAFIPFLGHILGQAAAAVASTYSGAVVVIYYFDRRCRTEDFDLRLLSEQIRMEGEPGLTAAPGSSSLA